MNRYDLTNMSPTKMREHIRLAKDNRRAIEAKPDPEAELGAMVRVCDVMWVVWPDKGPGTRLGHGLCIVKGTLMFEAIVSAGSGVAVMETTQWFPSFEAALDAFDQDGDGFLLAA